MANIGNLGSLFSGFAQGAQSGIKLGLQGEQIAMQRDQLDFRKQLEKRNARKQDLEFMLKVGEALDEAMLLEEPFRGAAIDSTLQAAENALGVKVPKQFIKLLHDPEAGPALRDTMRQTGITLEQVFKATGADPMMTTQLLLSFGKATREQNFGKILKELGGASPGERPGAPTTQTATPIPLPNQSQPQVTPLPMGAPTPSGVSPQNIPSGVPSPAPATGVQAPTPALRVNTARLQDELSRLQEHRAQLVAIPGMQPRRLEVATKAIDDRIKQINEQIAELTTKPELARQTELRQPMSEEVLQFSREMLINLGRAKNSTEAAKVLPAGMTRGDYERVMKESVSGAPPTSERDALPLTPTEVRRSKLADETAAAEERTRAESAIRSSYKTFDEIKQNADRARSARDLLGSMAAAARNVGITGPWITPVRDTINSAAQLFGVRNPAGMAPRELITSLNKQLATRMTQMQKGQQSDKELFLAIMSNPGEFNSEKGMAVMIFAANEMANKVIMYEAEARAWQAQHKHLDALDSNGLSFQDVFEAKMRNYNRQYGTISERIEKALKVDSKQLLRGVIRSM